MWKIKISDWPVVTYYPRSLVLYNGDGTSYDSSLLDFDLCNAFMQRKMKCKINFSYPVGGLIFKKLVGAVTLYFHKLKYSCDLVKKSCD